MRGPFGIVALLISAALVGWLAQRQLAPSPAGVSLPASAAADGVMPPAKTASSPSALPRQIGAEVQRSLDQSAERLQQVDR